jgi:[protein-PII] uridylyltransferase
VASTYQTARAELLATNLPPNEIVIKLGALSNEWLQELFAQVCSEPGIALIAVGGFGRLELSPGSDLDLVLLHTAEQKIAAEKIAEKIWYPIWDSGVPLDHSVRTIGQTRDLAQVDHKVMLGMLDARVVAGDVELGEKLRTELLQDWRKNFKKRLPDLQQADAIRHKTFGDLAHLQQPNLKEAQGGLRDLVTLRALTATWQIQVPQADLGQAKATLIAARASLHQVTNRSVEVLSQELQHDVAVKAGYQNADELLKAIYGASRVISFAYSQAWRSITNLIANKPGLFAKKNVRTPLADGVVLDGLDATLATGATIDTDPGLPFRVAAAAAEAGVLINMDAIKRLQECPVPEVWSNSIRESFISLLGSGSNLIEIWELLDQTGFISKWIPHWDVVRSAPQRNSVHIYTVDRHLVQTAVEANSLIRNVARPDLLLVGSLMHDIGKARLGDHSEVGALLIREIAPSMGFSAADSKVLEVMVALHLLLPDTATRRDLEDPSTIATVAQKVETLEILDLLHQLAIADARATSPIASSAWRLKLIQQLRDSVAAVLQGSMPPAPPELVDHLDLDEAGLGLIVEPEEDHLLIKVSAPDQNGLLALTAGVFALHRLVVRSARTRTISDRAISHWRVAPLFGDAPSVALLRSELRRALNGTLDVQSELLTREQSAITRTTLSAKPRVLIDNVSSDKATILEVRTHDASGVLNRIAKAITSTNTNITAAHVSTLGAEVDDVFYLVNSQNLPLTQEEQAEVVSAVSVALTNR